MARARKRKKTLIPKILILVFIISGIVTVVLRLLNRRLQVTELGEIGGYASTAFAISLIIIVGIWIVSLVNRN